MSFIPIKSLRKKALKEAERWMIEHMDGEGWPGSYISGYGLFNFCTPGVRDMRRITRLIQKALGEIEELELSIPIRCK